MLEKEMPGPGGNQEPGEQQAQRNYSLVAGLSQAMQPHGLTCPPDLEPGKYRRFAGAGKEADNLAGWAMTFDDGTGAVFGDWSSGLSEVFRLEPAEPLTDEEEREFREKTKAASKQAEKARKAAQDRAAVQGRGDMASGGRGKGTPIP